MKHLYSFVFALAMIFSTSLNAQTQVDTVGATNDFYCDFENDTDNLAWTFVNGTMTNRWYIGTGVSFSTEGSKSMYISNDGGISQNYDGYSASTVYAYRDLYFEAGYYTYYYNWSCQGQWDDYHIKRIILKP